MVRAASLAVLVAVLAVAPGASAARPQSEPLRAHADGFLTHPSGERPAELALDYVRAHPRVFDLDANDVGALHLTRAYRSNGGAVHLQWEQRYRGIPVFGPGLRANVAADGRLINVGEGALPDAGVASIVPRLSALDALLAAARDANLAIAPGRPSAPRGSERTTTFSGGDRASLTLFDGGRLAWRLLLHGDPRHVYDTVVDANTGATLYRVNMVKEAADDALVFQNYPGAPVGGTQVTRSLTPYLSEAPRTRLFGAFAHVYSDPDDDIDGDPSTPEGTVQPGDEIPPTGSGDWLYSQTTQAASQPGQHCPAVGCSWNGFDSLSSTWMANLNQAGTQLFYYVNAYHDHLRDAPGIGFTSAAGAFEGADRVQAQVDDGAATDGVGPDCDHSANAYVLAVPDGQPLLMQVYLWTNACWANTLALNDVNAADDAAIIYHEYTHGMTNRLVTDASGNPAMNGWQPGAMDEGFADWFALDFLVQQGLETDTGAPGDLMLGRYENDKLRTQPLDCPISSGAPACPAGGYTYADYGKVCTCGPEVHADGEIWSETLWDLRTRMIAAHGATIGVNRTRALLTDGLRLVGANPTFLQMRDAILQADTSRGFGDRALIWSVFAARGMGALAQTAGSNDVAPVANFSQPPPQGPVAPVSPTPRADTKRPRVSKATLARRSFKVGARSAFKFTLSEPASVEIAIARADSGRRFHGRCRPASRKLRKRPRCTRYLSVGALTRSNLSAGAHSISFSGRLRGRGLKPGAYKVTLRATDRTGNRSSATTTSFRILRR